MVKRLIDRGRVPYGGGYTVNRPDLGMVGYGTLFDGLVASVAKYRRSNSIPIGLGFPDELERLVCELYPAECHDCNPLIPGKPHRLGLGDVINGTKFAMNFTLATIKEGQKPIVSLAEASRRANICADLCAKKYNVPFAKPCGGGCGELREIVKALIGNQETPRKDELNACFICKCFLESAVWVRLDVQMKSVTDQQKAQFESIPWCWKKASLIESH